MQRRKEKEFLTSGIIEARKEVRVRKLDCSGRFVTALCPMVLIDGLEVIKVKNAPLGRNKPETVF